MRSPRMPRVTIEVPPPPPMPSTASTSVQRGQETLEGLAHCGHCRAAIGPAQERRSVRVVRRYLGMADIVRDCGRPDADIYQHRRRTGFDDDVAQIREFRPLGIRRSHDEDTHHPDPGEAPPSPVCGRRNWR